MFGPVVEKLFLMIVTFTLVPIVLMAAVGFVVSLVQAITQIQEQALVLLAKRLVLGVLIVVFGSWASSQLVEYFQTNLRGLSALGRI